MDTSNENRVGARPRADAPWEQRLVVGPLQVNCWIVRCPETGAAAVIDAGEDADEIERALRSDAGFKEARLLLLTHGHFDHVGGVGALGTALSLSGPKPQVAMHRADELLYANAPRLAEFFGVSCAETPPVDRWLEDGEVIEVGALRLRVLQTPGHSPGGVCFHLSGDPKLGVSETVYCGDTLFRGGLGRTDLLGGDAMALLDSVRTKLLVLDDGVRVCPGHGPVSTIGYERRANPYLQD